jgi:undecaprenyl-diphosphatase
MPTRRWRIGLQAGYIPHLALWEFLVISFQRLAEPLGITIVLTIVLLFDRRGGPIVIHCLWALLIAVLFINIGKQSIERIRPYASVASNPYARGDRPLDSFRWSESWKGFRFTDRRYADKAFPSGHSAAVFSYAAILAWFYPRLRIVIFLAASCSSLSRFFMEEHWLTDCYAGSLLGLTSGYLSLRPWIYIDFIIGHWKRKRTLDNSDFIH